MKKPISSLAIGVCLLALSGGVAFANNLHALVANPPPPLPGNPPLIVTPNNTGHTGSDLFANCAGTASGPNQTTSFGTGSTPGQSANAMNKAGTNGSPFSSVAKTYAGNPGNPATNPIAHAQYDNACSQATLH
jgi:hypothetical protein